MHVESQTVVVDSINQTTLLDRKATIAQGNIVKQRDALYSIFGDQTKAIKELTRESEGYRFEADTLRLANKELRQGIVFKNEELSAKQASFDFEKYLLNAEIKTQKKKKWYWSMGAFILGCIATGVAFVF